VALDGVDLHVRAGEVVALVGKNGAGLVVAAAGAGLLPAGNLIEFYGVLLQDRPNSYGAYGLGQEPWIGSDVGWITFLLGALILSSAGYSPPSGWRGPACVRAGWWPSRPAGPRSAGPQSLRARAGPAQRGCADRLRAAWSLFGRLLLRRPGAVP
jgi:hypothetical protein